MNRLAYPYIFIFGFCLLALGTQAQSKKAKQDTNGITVVQDDRITELIKTYGETQPDGVPGHRVQIFFSAKKAVALNVKTSFTEKFPDYTVRVDYAVPYFKVLAGAFRTKLQGEKLLKLVKEEFPGAFIVSSNIPIEEFDKER